MTNTLFNRVLVLKKDELGVPEERKILHGKYCLEQFISFFSILQAWIKTTYKSVGVVVLIHTVVLKCMTII